MPRRTTAAPTHARRGVDLRSLLAAALLAPASVWAVVSYSGLAGPDVPRATAALAAERADLTPTEAALHADDRPFDGRPDAVLPPTPDAHRAAATRASRAAARPAHRWVLPANGPESSPYGWRWGRLHQGVDLAAPYGAAVVAATDGVVESVGWESGYGRLIVIRDWDGTETAYAHLSAFETSVGQAVQAGTLIGRVGATGDATGPHLHFEVRVGGIAIDPAGFLAARGVTV